MTKKKKVYDTSLIDSIRLRTALYDALVAPKVDPLEYVHHMLYPDYNYDEAPDSFGASTWMSNAFYDWNMTKAETERDAAFGDYILSDLDYNTLLLLKDYLNTRREINQLTTQLGEDPNNDEIKLNLADAYAKLEAAKPSYDKAMSSKFNNSYLNDYISINLLKGKYDSVLSEIDKETEPIDDLLGGVRDDNLYGHRINSLKKAKEQSDKAKHFQDKITSEYYKGKKEQPGMDLTDIDTYLYKMPGLLGSSSATLGATIKSTVSAIIASRASNPLVAGTAAVSAIGSNLYSRDQESKAEVYQNYKLSVKNTAKRLGIDENVMADAKIQLAQKGYTTEQINDDEFVYDRLLTGDIELDNVKFNKAMLQNRDGLRSLYTDNMALSASDVVQQAIEVVPIGKMASKVKGLGTLLSKASKAQRGVKKALADRIDDVTSFGLENIDKIARRTKRRAVLDLGGRILLSAGLEGAEEGIQYIKGLNYINGEFDEDPNLVKSFFRNIGTGARSIFAAITPWDPVYSNDQEFLENFKGGALLGGIMTGTIGTATTAMQLRDLLPADRFVSSLYAELSDAKDRVRKNTKYGEFIRTGRYENLMSSFDTAEDMASRTEGLDVADILAERDRAKTFRNIYTAPSTIKSALKAGIDPRTEEYDAYVALMDHHNALVAETGKRHSEATSEVESILYSPEMSLYIASIFPTKDMDDPVGAENTIRELIRLKSELDIYRELAKDFNNHGTKLADLEKNVGIHTSKADVIKFAHLINTNVKLLEQQYNHLLELAKSVNITEDQLVVPELHLTLKDAQEKEILTNLDLERAKAELDIMKTPRGAKAKVNKWLDVEDKEDTFVLELNDLYSGKALENSIIEGEEIGPEPLEPASNAPQPLQPAPQPLAPLNAPETHSKPRTDTFTLLGEQGIGDKKGTVKTPENASEDGQAEIDAIRNKILSRRESDEFIKTADGRYIPNSNTYTEATKALKDIAKHIDPRIDNYKEYAVANKMFNDDSEDGLKVLWEDLRTARDQYEEAIIDNEPTEELKDKVEQLTSLAYFMMNGLKRIRAHMEELLQTRLEELKLARQDEEQAAKLREEQKAADRKAKVELNDTTPIKSNDAVPVAPVKSTETKSAKVEPTLSDLLGDLLGEDAAKGLNQPLGQSLIELPQQSLSFTEATPEPVNQGNPLTYDRYEDPYSREINYRLGSNQRNPDGTWTRISRKYQGMEEFLNDEDLAKISAKPDFLAEVTKNGVYFIVKPYTNPQGVTEPAIYAIFTYKGKKYAGAIKTVEGGLKGNKRFNSLSPELLLNIINNLITLRLKIIELFEQTKANPNLQVVPTMLHTTTGRFVNEKNSDNSPKNRNLLDSKWLPIKNPFDITPDNTKVSITTGPLNGKVIRYKNHTLSGRGSQLGLPMWEIKVPRADGGYDTKLVKLNYKTFKDSPQIADLILDLVTSNEQFYTDTNGVKTPLTPIGLLSFIVNYGSHTAVDPADERLDPSQRQAKLRKLFYTDTNGNIVIGNTTYTVSDLISNKAVRGQAKQYIMDNFHWAIDEEALNTYYLGGDLLTQTTDPRLKSLAVFFKNSSVDKLSIIPGTLEFDQSEFGIAKGENGRKSVDSKYPKGMSTLGWYIKNGILLTDIADELLDANIYVDDVMLVDKSALDTARAANKALQDAQNKGVLESTPEARKSQEGAENASEGHSNSTFTVTNPDGSVDTLDMNDIWAMLDGKKRGPNMEVLPPEPKKSSTSKRTGIIQRAKDKLSEVADFLFDDAVGFKEEDEDASSNESNTEAAILWISLTLGVPVEIVPNVIETTEAGTEVVGRVTEDSILLSTVAPEGTGYHEAWHRVSLLCIDETRRKRIYRRMRRKNPYTSDRQLDEMLADQFKQFVLDDTFGVYDYDVKNWFLRILNFIHLWLETGSYALARVYSDILRGKFYGIKPSKENIERFRSIYGQDGPNMEVAGHELKTILLYKQFDDIVKSFTFAYFGLNGSIAVPNIEYSALAKNNQQFERLKLIIQAQANRYPSPVVNEILEKFDTVFMPAVATRLKLFGIRAIDRNEDDAMIDAEEGVESVNVGQHIVEGMNISIKDNAPAEVKFFFSTVPLYEIGKDGSVSMKTDTITHFPMFVDTDTAWNNVLKDLSGCRTIKNILDKVLMYTLNGNLFYRALMFKLSRLIEDSYLKDDLAKAADAEAMLTKIETVVTCDINDYVTVKVSNDKETGFTTFSLTDNTVDTKAIAYPRVWSQALFTNGGLFKYDSLGNVIAEDGAKKGLDTVIKNLNSVITAFRNNKGILRVGDRLIDLHIPANLSMLKKYLVSMFNAIGIMIDVPTIDKMLISGKYGNPKSDAFTLLSEFVTSKENFGGIPKVISILDTIKRAINDDSTIKLIKLNEVTIRPEQVWNNNGFVKELANYYALVHATDSSLSSYGPDGSTYYMVSLNNFAKDRLNEIVTDTDVLAELNAVVYNGHSIILQAANNGNRDLAVETFINFKDTTTGDTGRDYHGITDREDYIAKMTAIFNDRIIFPTVADKKTYHFIKGVKLPHDALRFTDQNGLTFVTYGEQAMDYLLGYCYDELALIELCLRLIDDDPNHYNPETGLHYNDDGTINNDWLEPSQRIQNFHTPNKYKYTDKDGIEHTVTLEGNGARFLFLTGIYTDKGFVNFNDPTKSAKECLLLAKDYFFNNSVETQKAFLAGVINRRVKQELKYAQQLGLIEMNENGNIWSIRNKLLDDAVVTLRTARYTTMDSANAEGYAVFDMISDYVINSIISILEVEKLFNGAPAYYKVKYDENGIVDESIDKIKRLGALTSTGLNNRLDFFNDPMRDEYTVAELKDHEIMDRQYHEYERLFYRANIKEAVQEMVGEEAWDEVKDLSIQEIEKKYPEATKVAKQAAKVAVAGYKKGVNVADAAVYISSAMTRDLLRMRGVWSADIKKAFDILTNPETADKWESDPKLYAEANKVILNAMKYVAFGTRFRNGLGIPYFNKMALFPLFKSVATGDIKALYDRMVDETNPIDMVMFNSAVKAGSQSPTSFYRQAKDSEIELKDGQTTLAAEIVDHAESGQGTVITDLSKLVTYTLKFKYIRQQLETNPHVHPDQMAGTQFLKVNMSNLRMNDLYGPDGWLVTGREIKETVMNALNFLSDMGKLDIADRLFKDDKVNITALGKMLQQDARESDANDNVLSGLRTKDDAFLIPLSALSDNKWLESRFISLLNKEIIDVHMPGGAFIQRPPFGIEATAHQVITESMINDGKPLLMINEKDGSMDSIVSINLFKHIIPNYDKMTFKLARQWLLDHNIIGLNAEATGIGYRIPTQSVASISALRFVDVLPEIMGDTIVLPEGFTKLTGSDKYRCLNQYNIKHCVNCGKPKSVTLMATRSQVLRYSSRV